MSSNITCRPRFAFHVAYRHQRVPCRHLPPSDALVIDSGLKGDRIRLLATGEPLPLLRFMLLEQPVRSKVGLNVFMVMLGTAFDKGIQLQGCYALLFRHGFPDCSDDDVMVMVQEMFDAPTHELIEQELDPLI